MIPNPSSQPPPLHGMTDNGGNLLPHFRTFAAIFNQSTRQYHWRWDEAVKRSQYNALAMRRDAFIMSLLRERQLPTAQLPWHLATDDDKDPVQKEYVSQLTAIVNQTPHTTKLMLSLLEAVWYGRYGVQIAGWKDDVVMGKRRKVVAGHSPLNGDKIQYTYDGVPCVMVSSTWQPPPNVQANIVTGERSKMLMLDTPFWRERFIIHKHECDDADYFEGEMAGAIHGVGLRSRLNWCWDLRDELLAWMISFMEKVGTLGIMIFWYEEGNAVQKEAAETAAREVSNTSALAVPRSRANDKPTQGVDNIPATPAGVQFLKEVIQEYFEKHMERLVIGQELSSSSKSTGLGSGVADFQADTKYQIIKFDSENLAETLTTDFLRPLSRFNFGEVPFNVRWQFDLAQADSDKKLEAATKLISAGVPLVVDEVREIGGFTKPGPDDEVTQAPPGPGGMPPGMDPMDPNGGPLPPDAATPADRPPLAREAQQPPAMAFDAGTGSPFLDALSTAAADVHPEPSQAQKDAGNHRMGHVVWKGIPITIERAKGHTRSGVSKDGKTWSTVLQDHYGYVKRTESDADGDHIDVYLSEDYPDSDVVFVVNQVKPNKGNRFDEHKCILGQVSLAGAKGCYLRNYAPGWKGLGSITSLTVDQFKAWMDRGNTAVRLDPDQFLAFEALAREVELPSDPTATPFEPASPVVTKTVEFTASKHGEPPIMPKPGEAAESVEALPDPVIGVDMASAGKDQSVLLVFDEAEGVDAQFFDASGESVFYSEFRESAHPRGKDGRFIPAGDIAAAANDPVKAAALRQHVRPEDAGKLNQMIRHVTPRPDTTPKGPGLPDLEGASPKQVQWAHDIRSRMLNMILDHERAMEGHDLSDGDKLYLERLHDLAKLLPRIKSAAFFLDSRDVPLTSDFMMKIAHDAAGLGPLTMREWAAEAARPREEAPPQRVVPKERTYADIRLLTGERPASKPPATTPTAPLAREVEQPATTQETMAKALDLRKQADDASSRGDWSAAAQLYRDAAATTASPTAKRLWSDWASKAERRAQAAAKTPEQHAAELKASLTPPDPSTMDEAAKARRVEHLKGAIDKASKALESSNWRTSGDEKDAHRQVIAESQRELARLTKPSTLTPAGPKPVGPPPPPPPPIKPPRVPTPSTSAIVPVQRQALTGTVERPTSAPDLLENQLRINRQIEERKRANDALGIKSDADGYPLNKGSSGGFAWTPGPVTAEEGAQRIAAANAAMAKLATPAAPQASNVSAPSTPSPLTGDPLTDARNAAASKDYAAVAKHLREAADAEPVKAKRERLRKDALEADLASRRPPEYARPVSLPTLSMATPAMPHTAAKPGTTPPRPRTEYARRIRSKPYAAQLASLNQSHPEATRTPAQAEAWKDAFTGYLKLLSGKADDGKLMHDNEYHLMQQRVQAALDRFKSNGDEKLPFQRVIA